MKKRVNLYRAYLIAMLCSAATLNAQVYEPDPKNDWQDPDKSVNDACTSCLGVFHNYVCNPSFDDYRTTINGPIDCENLFQRATTWGRVKRQGAASDHSGTPDLWYTGQQDPAQVPTQGYASNCILWRNGNNTPFGTQAALQLPGYSDQSFVGVGTYVSPTLFTNLYDPQNFPTRESREYIVTRLKQPLKPNTTYTISMYVSLGEISELTTPLQVLVSNRYEFNIPLIQQEYGALKPYLSPAETANIRTLTTGVADKDGWTKVSVTFNPGNVNNLEYLIIGYFEKDDVADLQTSVVAPSSNPPGYTYRLSHSTYYFIDQVMVEECTAPLVLGRCGGDLYYSQVAPLIAANSHILIDGRLIIDQNTIINGRDLAFSPNGMLYVSPGIQFALRNSYLHGCNEMWPGVYADTHSRIEAESCRFEDAYNALALNGASGFNIKSCTFDLNQTGILVKNHSATGYQRQVTGCAFQATDYCKYPLGSQLPETGVLVQNCTSAPEIGLYSSGINTFTGLRNGVLVKSSDVSIANNRFEQIGQGLGGWAIDLVNPQQAGSTPVYTAAVGGLVNSNQRNMVLDSDQGIRASGHWKTKIYRNQFSGISGIAISLVAGYRASGNQTAHHVRMNNIQKARTGINIEGQGYSSVYRIQRNTLSNIGGPVAGSIGIRVFDKSGRTGKCSPSIYHNIDSNSVMRFDRGIDMEGGSCSNIRWNKIYTLVAYYENFERTGIWYRNSVSVNVLKNEVEGTSTEWNRNVGIRAENVSLSDCGCNKVTKTHVALFTGLPNLAMRVFNNSVHDAKDGLLINYGALGNQAFDRNNPAVTLDPINTFFGMVPRQGYPNGVEAFANFCAPNHTTYFDSIVRAANGSPIDLGIPSNTDPSLLRDICLYLKEKRDSTAYIPTVEAAFAAAEPEEGLYAESHRFLHRQRLYEMYLQDMALKDSSALVAGYIQQIKGTPAAQWAEFYMTLSLDIEAAESMLAGLPAPGNIEQLHAQFAPVYIRYLRNGAGGMDHTDRGTLQYIAAQCYVEYGDVVSMSRSLLLHIWGEETMPPACDRLDEPTDLLPPAEEPAEGGFFTLSPNPATGQVNIRSNFMEPCTYSILNALGHTVLTGTAYPGDNFTGIGSLSPGNYHVRLLYNGELLEDKILLVQ